VSVSVRWTPAEVLAIHTACLREMEADPRAPYVPGIVRSCAMAECGRAAEGAALIVNVPGLPGPFVVDLCNPCRAPFDSGMEAVEHLVVGDSEVLAEASRLTRPNQIALPPNEPDQGEEGRA